MVSWFCAALLRHSPRDEFWSDFVPRLERWRLRAAAHSEGTGTLSENWSWQMSRSELISLTRIECSGCPLTGTGRLRGLGQMGTAAARTPHKRAQTLLKTASATLGTAMASPITHKMAAGPAPRWRRSRPAAPPAHPRRAPSPSPRPPALPRSRSIPTAPPYPPQRPPPALTSVPPSRCGAGASGARPPLPVLSPPFTARRHAGRQRLSPPPLRRLRPPRRRPPARRPSR